MKKYSALWHEINTLLSYLNSFAIVDKVDDYYLKIYGNDAPGKLMQDSINKLQKRLDKAK